MHGTQENPPDLNMRWPRLTRELPPDSFLAALGALVVRYNDLEFALYGVLGCFIPEEAVPALYYELHNTGRVNAITALARERLSDDQREALAHGLKCFKICAENRNLIVHAMADRIWSGPTKRVQVFVKGVAGKPGNVAEYGFTTDHVREAALSIDLATAYLYELVDTLTSDLFGEDGDEQLPLPVMPPLPVALSLQRMPEPPMEDLL